jgi:hypothetical protein
MRAPTGTRIRVTKELAIQALEAIKDKAHAENVDISVGYVGLLPSSYPINTIYLWMRGPEEAVLRVALKPGSTVRVEDLKKELRQDLPERLGRWLRKKLTDEKLPADQVAERVRRLKFSFEPADIVNEVMSFGSPTPVEIAISGLAFTGKKRAEHFGDVERVRAELAKVPSLRDLQFVQPLDYPAVEVKVDRQLAGSSGVTTEDVANSLVAATSSSRFVVPNYWADPATGIGYQVQVQIPTLRMNSAREVGLVPIKRPGQRGQLFLQDVARVGQGTKPGQYDRYNMKRLVSLTANIAGEDLGRVAGQIVRAIEAAGEAPRGVNVDVRGQVVPMQQMFGGAGRRQGLRGPYGRPGAGGGGHFLAADRLLPIAPAGPGRHAHRPGGARRRGGSPARDRNDAEHPVIHGRHHGRWCRHRQRHLARHLRRACPPGRATRGPGSPGRCPPSAAADPDDHLRHDRRHGAAGAGAGGRGGADGPAGPGRHRRAGGGHGHDPAGPAGHIRNGHGLGRGVRIALREVQVLRPAALCLRRHPRLGPPQVPVAGPRRPGEYLFRPRWECGRRPANEPAEDAPCLRGES